ncbi:hypothetical protein GYA25_02275 [Candidatus Woesearchaeota archaeon]|nr:hypothetical protein [Candidatus Woesearchaeota archaeon]
MESNSKIKVIEYLKKNIKKGYPLETLRIALINQNYSRALIDEAIKEVVNQMAKEVPIIKDKPLIEHEIIIEDNHKEKVIKEKGFFSRLINYFKN